MVKVHVRVVYQSTYDPSGVVYPATSILNDRSLYACATPNAAYNCLLCVSVAIASLQQMKPGLFNFTALSAIVLCAVVGESLSKRLSVLLASVPLSGHIATPINLGEELVRRGHNVTFFTVHYEGDDRPKKSAERAGMTFVSADTNVSYDTIAQVEEQLTDINCGLICTLYAAATYALPHFLHILRVAKHALDTPSMRKYDVILVEDFTAPVGMCLNDKWGVPTIVISTSITREPPAWPIPGSFSTYSDNLDFKGRLFIAFDRSALFAIMYVLGKVIGASIDCMGSTELHGSRGPGVTLPNIVPVAMGYEYPRTLAPLVTYTGPILSTHTEPLTEDIQIWLDSHPKGSVVYISMGSIVFLTQQAARAIVEGLSATGYCAVWSLKMKNRAILDGLEMNDKKILLLDWAPQVAILRHRSIRMAILHGGMNGVQEALHSGVPVIVLPVFGDQWGNAGRVMHNGLGIVLHHNNLTGTHIAEGIRTIERGNYSETVSKLRKIFHHAGGVTKAADLVEFYAEFGYDHLIPAYARYEWTWIHYFNIDMYGLILAVGCLVVWIVYQVCANERNDLK